MSHEPLPPFFDPDRRTDPRAARTASPPANWPARLGVALGLANLALIGLPGFVLGPLGLLFGIAARTREGGQRLAVVAIVLGVVGTAVGIFWLVKLQELGDQLRFGPGG